MPKEDLCNRCHHTRGAHSLVLGTDGTGCSWTHCRCEKFEE